MRSYPIHALVFAIAISSFFTACSNVDQRLLEIPAGSASQTLKEFAKQAEVEIIFDANSVEGVKTNPVNGMLDPYVALAMMLKDTQLTIGAYDEAGAYAVVRNRGYR